jgi:hypothetical protein
MFFAYLESILIFYTFFSFLDIKFKKKQLLFLALFDSLTIYLVKTNIYNLFNLPHGTHILISMFTMSVYLKIFIKNISFIKIAIIPLLTYIIYFITDLILLLKIAKYFSIDTVKTNIFILFFLAIIENTGILLILFLNKYFGLKLKIQN